MSPYYTSLNKGRIDERSENIPDLGKAFTRRLAHGRRVLVPKHRPIRIVVELAVAGTPPKHQRKPVGENKSRHHAQSGRPDVDSAEGRLRPVHGAYERTHLTATSEKVLDQMRSFTPGFFRGHS